MPPIGGARLSTITVGHQHGSSGGEADIAAQSVLRTLVPTRPLQGDFSRAGSSNSLPPTRRPLTRRQFFGAQNSFSHSEAGQTVARGLASRARRTRPRARRCAAAGGGGRGGAGGHQCVGRRPRGGVRCDRGKGDGLCGAACGGLWVVDGGVARVVNARNLPRPLVEFQTA